VVVLAWELLVISTKSFFEAYMFIDRILFSDPLPLLMKKSLDFNSARHLLISSNISNMDTPGYRAHDLDFKEQLRQAVGQNGSLNLKSTHATHFGPSALSLENLAPVPFETNGEEKSNGNNVNIDEEMARLAENQIRYSAVMQMMTKRNSILGSAVSEVA